MKKREWKRPKISIRWQMVGMMLLYWVLPFLLIIGGVRSHLVHRQEQAIVEQLASRLELDNQICIERLDSAISDSRQATYDRTLYECYEQYRKDPSAFNTAYNKGQYYLEKQYGKRMEISATIFFILDNPEKLKMTNYNTPAGGSYRQLETYWKRDHEAVIKLAETLDTSIGLYFVQGRLYLVRNLVDSSYHPWGILVHRLNLSYCLEPVLKSYEGMEAKIKIGNEEVILQGEPEQWESLASLKPEKKASSQIEKNRVIIAQEVQGSDFCLSTILLGKPENVFTPIYGYGFLILSLVLFLLPMIFLFQFMSRKYLIQPLNKMVEHAEEIEKGNLGYQLSEHMSSLEFEYLRESLNHMSRRLKYQFDHIYEEELALRDAKIMALQSHINPHFMNNTLEIINWEARLGGNEKISKMIGALSTLLDAAIDRRKRPEVTLSEELIYVRAYLYITSERLGKRLKIVQDFQEETLALMVPRLILQPIIENAVEHGVVRRGEGTVTLKSYVRERFLVLEIINDGELEEEDRKKIERLLAPDYDTSMESSGNMGIANVNQRLRILYGEECGLSIGREKGRIVSRLLILKREKGQDNARIHSSSYSKNQRNGS